MSRTNIILSRLYGLRKKTVGRMLAQALKYEFLDTDQLIEQRFKMTMQVIVADRGEKAFLDMEPR